MQGIWMSALTALLAWSGWTQRLDTWMYDMGQRIWQKAPPQDIVIVAIDEASLRALGRWPWRRAVHASILNKIAAQQPKAILLHVLLPEPDADVSQDLALAQALEKVAGKTVLPMGFDLSSFSTAGLIHPTTALAQHAQVGHADVALDADGILRQLHLRAGWPEVQWPHVAQRLWDVLHQRPYLAVHYADKLPALSAAHWQRQDPIGLWFYGPPGTIKTISYVDVLADKLPATTFHNATVLIGATAQGLGDRFMTPVSTDGRPMASIEIVAQTVGMLQEGRTIQPLSMPWVAAISAALIFVLIMCFWMRSPREGLLIALGLLVAAPLLSLTLMGLGVWAPTGALLVMAALAYPWWSWRRLESASQLLTMQLERLGHPVGSPSHQRWQGYMERQAQAIDLLYAQKASAYQLVNSVIDQLPCAVIVVDRQGRVLRVNERFKQMVGSSTVAANDEHSGIQHLALSGLLEGWQPSEATGWDAWLAQARHAAQGHVMEVKGPAGQTCLASIVAMRHETDELDRVIICLLDITAGKQAEAQRDELLGFLAHDIRSPQASLLSLVELHGINPNVMPVDELLKHVSNLARGTVALSEELIHVIRSESHPLQLTKMSLAQVIASACAVVEPQALASGVRIVTQGMPAADAQIEADERLLQRAITNLLTNAIRFSPPQGEVQVGLTAAANVWEISIADQGEGIAPDHLSKLFRRYSRLNEQGIRQKDKGFGLGLVFVETVFKRHGGSVSVNSLTGQGTVFTCTLPRRKP